MCVQCLYTFVFIGSYAISTLNNGLEKENKIKQFVVYSFSVCWFGVEVILVGWSSWIAQRVVGSFPIQDSFM